MRRTFLYLHVVNLQAHGVYEGSYWELIGDCDEMMEMLRKLSKAPALMEEPSLDLPAAPDLPRYASSMRKVIQTQIIVIL